MFYVGCFVHYNGAPRASEAKARIIEKLGHSRGRGERFLNSHPPKEIEGQPYRALVFVMPNRFVLRNDVIKMTMKTYKCDWATAKFHLYRLGAADGMGKQDVWADLLTEAKAVEDAMKTTEEPQNVVLEANVPTIPDIGKVEVS